MKTIKTECLQKIQKIILKHKGIKLIIIPKKVSYNDDLDYGNNIMTEKFMAYMPSCKYKTNDIPVLNTMVKIKSAINLSKDPIETLMLILSLYYKNPSIFKLTIVPYPDRLSDNRSEDIEGLF